jgi:hypothetical protein
MIRKNLSFVFCMLLLVGFVISQAGEGQQGTVREPIMGGENGNEVMGERISVNGQVLMEVPRGFEITEADPGRATIHQFGEQGNLQGKVYTLRNTGNNAKPEDSIAVKFGNSEVDVPLFSEAKIAQDKNGNWYLDSNFGSNNSITLTTPSGTFEKVSGARFKLDENGEILKADFFPPEDYATGAQSAYRFKTLNGQEVEFGGSGWGESAQIVFDAEKNEVMAHLGHGQKRGGHFYFYDGSGNVNFEGGPTQRSYVGLNAGLSDQEFPPSFSAKLDENGQIVSGTIRNGVYYHTDSEGISRAFYMPQEEASKEGFRIWRNNAEDVRGNTVFLQESNGLVESGFVTGPVKMSVDSRISSGDIVSKAAGYEYVGTSIDSSVDFRKGEQGQQVIIARDNFIIEGLSDPEPILRSQDGKVSWNTGSIKTEVPLDIYYGGASPSQPGMAVADIGGMQRIRTSTSPTEPTLQTQNTQLASAENPIAQTQEQQVARNSLFGRLFGSN